MAARRKTTVTVELTPAMFAYLKKAADAAVRSPDQQLLWYLKCQMDDNTRPENVNRLPTNGNGYQMEHHFSVDAVHYPGINDAAAVLIPEVVSPPSPMSPHPQLSAVPEGVIGEQKPMSAFGGVMAFSKSGPQGTTLWKVDAGLWSEFEANQINKLSYQAVGEFEGFVYYRGS